MNDIEAMEQELAVEIIRKWKEHPEIRTKFKDDFRLFSISELERRLWNSNPALRAEFFDDYSCYLAYRMNAHRVRICGGKEISEK